MWRRTWRIAITGIALVWAMMYIWIASAGVASMGDGKMVLVDILGIQSVRNLRETRSIQCAQNPQAEQGTQYVQNSGSEEKYVALTFDDGPNDKYTMKLLDGLKERGVHASFFLLGENIDGKEAIVRQIHEDGHLIGNHTYRHIQLTTASEKLACEYVDTTNRKIEEITGRKPEYLRPPYGDWNDKLDCLFSMTKVLWTVDSRDWQYRNKNHIVKHVLSDVESGDIILMHDIFQTSVDAALEIVDRLLADGYRFVTVDEMLIE